MGIIRTLLIGGTAAGAAAGATTLLVTAAPVAAPIAATYGIGAIVGYGAGSIMDDVISIIHMPIKTFAFSKDKRLEKKGIYHNNLSKACYEASERLDNTAEKYFSAVEEARIEIAKRKATRAAEKAVREAKLASSCQKTKKPKTRKSDGDADFTVAPA